MARAGWDDTIFALASGAGVAAIAVMRLSGAECATLLQRLIGTLPAPRRAALRTIRSADGLVLDRGIVLWMPGPASYTGEDSAELHLHASPAIIEAVAEALTRAGGRPAERGEYTRRAVLNGRMSLTEAEGVADLMVAETASQRDQALRQMDGALTELIAAWTTRARRLLSAAEASIDFPDESAGEQDQSAACEALIEEIEQHLAASRPAERLRDGLHFVVLGAPNAGKSSLVNALAGREASIVSDRPGTTRDVVEARIVLGGVPVVLEDTAGLRRSDDAVEAEGARRARARAAAADLVLAVCEAENDGEIAAGNDRVIRITSKIDLGAAAAGTVGVSVVTGEGLDVLRRLMTEAATQLTTTRSFGRFTRPRHRAAGQQAAAHLARAATSAEVDLRAEELRLALSALGRIAGPVDVEQILDDVFAQFCIGK